MFKNPYFYNEHGWLWWLLEIVVFVYAVLCLIVDVNTVYAWFILVTDILEITIHIIYYLASRKRYYREDSFWLRKDESEKENSSQDEIQS